MSHRIPRAILVLLIAAGCALPGFAGAGVVAITIDGDPATARPMLDSLRNEILSVAGTELEVVLPDDKVGGAHGTVDGARAANDRFLADDEVDLVIAYGVLVSIDMVERAGHAKPVIAPFAIDGLVRDLPRTAHGGSGLERMTYIQPVFDLADDVRRFREVVDFDVLAVVTGPGLAQRITAMPASQRAAFLSDATVVPVPFDGPAREVVRKIPADVDAVLVVGPNPGDGEDFGSLLEALNSRGLPTFSTSGEVAVRMGALAGLTPREWFDRLARRTALHARRLLSGESAARLPVLLSRQAGLYLNMTTAAALGISPTFELMSDAELIGDLTRIPDRTLDLIEIMRSAVESNRDLRAARHAVDAAVEGVDVARSRLLPQLDGLLAARRIDEDRAGLGTFGAETTIVAGLEFTQVLWSEAAWAGVGVEKELAEAARAALRQVELDVQLEAAEAYFDVLAALATEQIRRENLRLTRRNLERARVRRRLGAASAAEEYRWDSQVAADQDALVTSIAVRNVAEIELNRVLHRPLEEKLGVRDADREDILSAYVDPRLLTYIDDAASLRRLRRYVAEVAVRNSPEVAQVDAAIAVQRRLLDSEMRSFFSPEIALTGELTQTLDRSGNGADTLESQLDAADVNDLDWSVGIGLRIPMLEGGGRLAERARLHAEIARLERERDALGERIQQRARATVHVASASFTRVRLTERAEVAARKNFELVAEAYAQGVVSIIDLLDAQTAWFNAQQQQATALFQLMADILRVERAAGTYLVLATPEETDAAILRLETLGP